MSALFIVCTDCNGERVVYDEDAHQTEYPCSSCGAAGVIPRPSDWNDNPLYRLPDGKGFSIRRDTEAGRRRARLMGWKK